MSLGKNLEANSFMFTMFIVISLFVRANSLFCSAYCKPNSCTGISSNQCTACDTPFLWQTNGTCQVDPASGYALAAE